MKIIIANNYDEMSRIAAKQVAELVKIKPGCVLGLATGSTPEGMYRELIKLNQNGHIDFSHVKTFNLDEYRGISGSHPQSYKYYMDNKFFNHININRNNVLILDGMCEDIEHECEMYDKRIFEAGGIDLQVLGIGSNGHIGFNEPSDFLYTGTHLTPLTRDTIEANSRFFENMDEVPREAITMGLGGIMKAKEIMLLANGKQKAKIIRELVAGKINTRVPASILQVHSNVTVIIDREAASQLDIEQYDRIEVII